MLNEIEIAYWYLINSEIQIVKVKKEFFLQRMMMSALLSKKVSTDENQVNVFYAFLAHNYPRFMDSYV
jgi:hypothetical protein